MCGFFTKLNIAKFILNANVPVLAYRIIKGDIKITTKPKDKKDTTK